MNVNKKKKTLKITLLSSFFAISSVLTSSITLVSCTNKTDIKIPSSTANTFSSLSANIYPTIAGVLSAESGRESLTKSYVNKLLLNWFSSVNESSLETNYNDWKRNAEKSYNTEYDNYKKSKGNNWEQLFQQNVLDPVGGTKEDFIIDKINSNLKSKFIDNLFSSSSKEYLVYKTNNGSSNTITPIKEISAAELNGIDNKYVNAKNSGEKNGFTFAGEAISEVDRKTIDFGYADFLDFLMDNWIQNEMPLPLSMSLWKNGTSEVKVKQLFSNYFTQNKTPEGFAEGSYNFQYFEPIDENDSQKLTTTTKFKLLIENLNNGSYVNKTTGLINLNTQYTEDSSTILLVPSNKLFDGTYVTPFSAAAWYKFSNKVFGIKDDNVHVLSEIDSNSIMKNFLYFGNNTSSKPYQAQADNKKGVFEFPYSVKWDNNITQQNGSVFLGEYKDAQGIRDLVDLDENTKLKSTTNVNATTNNSVLGNFILVRNTFGVHIIGIDRLSKLTEAYKGSTNSVADAANFTYSNFQKVLNELRNTFIYYLAKDTRSSTDTYKVKESLKTYLTNNFESILLSYVKKYIDNPNSNQNNLFGAKVTSNNTNTINYNTNLGFVDELEGKSYTDYYKTLLELKQNGQDNKFRSLIDSSEDIKFAKKALDFNRQMKNAIYENQAKYNSNTSATAWIDNGIAGVLPFTRNGSNGDFTSLSQLINNIVSKKTSSTIQTSNDNFINKRASSQLGIVNGSNSITVNNVETYFKKQKLNYQTSVINYVNSLDLFIDPKKQTGISTYIFTNNEYINKALLVTGSDGTLNSIVYNSYIQKSLFPKGTIANSIISKSLSYASNTIGSTGWISEQIKNSIKSTYFVNNFVGIKNLYSEGDWNSYEDFQNKANTYWTSNWEREEYQYTITNPGSNQYGFNTYAKPSDSESYYKFLLTIKYLLSWNSKNQKFEFTKIHDILEKATRVTNSNSGKAMIAWQNMSSIVANPSFGISSSMDVSAIQTKMQNDSNFKSLPLYLTNSNSYSWLGQINPYKLASTSSNYNAASPTKNDLAYTTSANYWYTAPMKSTTSISKNTATSKTYNMGFLGFQMEDTSETGISNGLPAAAFDNVTYSYAISNNNNSNEQVKYRGMFYSFKTRNDIVQYVKELSTVNLLTDFYNKNLKDSGLPISEATKKKITEIIDGTESNRVELLQKEILSILNDTKQLPDVVFNKMDSMPLWNNENNVNSTLFATSDETQALKNQFIITQFNSNDVSKLITKTENSDGSTNITLNTGTDGFLGVGYEAFFNAILMMANSSTKLQSQAMDAMFREVGKIEIFDIRLLNVVDRIWISNYDVWKKIKDL